MRVDFQEAYHGAAKGILAAPSEVSAQMLIALEALASTTDEPVRDGMRVTAVELSLSVNPTPVLPPRSPSPFVHPLAPRTRWNWFLRLWHRIAQRGVMQVISEQLTPRRDRF